MVIWFAIAWHEWNFVFLTQLNSWKDTRRQLESPFSSLCAIVAANQAKWSLVCFYWELNNRWVLSNTDSNEQNILSQCFAKGLNYLSLLTIVYFSVKIISIILRSPFCDWKANQWDRKHNAFLVLSIIISILFRFTFCFCFRFWFSKWLA